MRFLIPFLENNKFEIARELANKDNPYSDNFMRLRSYTLQDKFQQYPIVIVSMRSLYNVHVDHTHWMEGGLFGRKLTILLCNCFPWYP